MKTEPKKAKSPLIVIFMIVFFDLVGFGIVIPIMPYYAKAFGATATQLGFLLAAYSASQFLFSPVWGSISDRIGRRPIMLMSVLGSFLSFLMLGFANSLAWLFIGRLLAGAFGANISTAAAYIADTTTPENRAKGMGVIGASFGLGFIFGPAIGGVLSQYGYPVPMFAAAALALFNLLFAWFKLEEPSISEDVRRLNRPKRFSKKVFQEIILGDVRSKMAVLVFFIVTIAFTQIEVAFALFMLERYHFNAIRSGWLLALMGVLAVIIQGTQIGKLSKRFGEFNLILAGTLIMCVGLATMALSHSIVVAVFSVALVGIGNALNNPSLSSLASQGAPENQKGAAMGIYQSAGALSRIVGPMMGGYFFDHFGIASPFLLSAFIYLGAFLIASRFYRQFKSLKNDKTLNFGLQ